jgi:UDP-glucose 4-epimerase
MGKILVTGGLGFIGSHCMVELLKVNKDLICIDNCSNSDINTLLRIRKIESKPFIFRKIGIESSELENIFQDNNIESIIHFAGLKSVGESVKFPAKYFYNNVIGSKHLFSLAKKYKIKNLIFSSSATVYGKPIFLPISEKHPVKPINPYGQNKIDIENIIISDSYFQNECSVKILRYFNPVGAHKSGFIGEYPKGIPNNLMPYVIDVAKKRFSNLMIFGGNYNTYDGTGVRDYIHIMDLIQGHIQALNYRKLGITIFNLGTGKGNSVLDLVKTFEKVNEIKIPFKIIDRRLGDVDIVFADTAKAKLLLNFSAIKTLEDMCKDAWHFALNIKR